MKSDEYYGLLKKKHEQTDWNSLASIKKYNEYARQLRREIESREDHKHG